MAKAVKAKPKLRQQLPHREKKKENDYAELEKVWLKRRAESGPSRVVEQTHQVDGKRAHQDLQGLYKVTGDPVFRAAAKALEAYGLSTATKKGTATRLADLLYLDPDIRDALEGIHHAEKAAIKAGTRFSIRHASAQFVAAFGTPGSSFESTTHRVRYMYAQARKRQDFFSDEPVVGDTGEVLLVLEQVGAAVKQVPNNLGWRRKIARHQLFVSSLEKKDR